MKKIISILPGDGIGLEVTEQAVKILDAIAGRFGHKFVYKYGKIGAVAIDQTGSPLPVDTLNDCKQSDAVLLGAVGHPRFDNDTSSGPRPEQGLLQLRKELQVYANIRPVKVYPSLMHRVPLKAELLQGVDFVIYRELTGGIYFGEKKSDVAQEYASDNCSYTRNEIERISHLAFQHAQKRRKKVTLVDKANVLATSRLWRRTVSNLAKYYPDVNLDFMYVDNAAMQLILNPRQFDVVLTENMFGDILSDEASVLTGSLGMLPSASVGDGVGLFEPIHGSYPQAVGQNIANPCGAVLSVAMMMEHFELMEEAKCIRDAVVNTLKNRIATKDVETVHYTMTSTVGDAISYHIDNILVTEEVTHTNQWLGQSTII